jgi:methyl-accepting chemotaxis protein
LSIKNLSHLNQVATTSNRNNTFILTKEIDHYKWMAKLMDLFLNEDVTSVLVPTDDHQCGLGKWLYGGAAETMVGNDQRLAALTAAIKVPHQKLHESALLIDQTYTAFDASLESLLAQRWIEHLVWIKNLSNSLLSGEKFTGGLAHTDCAFGKWFYGYETDNPALRNLLDTWEAPHMALHKSAIKINSALEGGDLNLARNIYQTETLTALQTLETSFNHTKEWVSSNIANQQRSKAIFDSATTSAMTQVQKGLGDIQQYLTEEAENATAEINQGFYTTNQMISVVSLLALLFGVAAAMFIIRAIIKPLNTATDHLDKSTEQIALTSSLIAASSEELAEGAAQQAAAIEETSASLEEISAMTKKNAENAGQAKLMVSEAEEVILKVDEHMNHMAEAINEISKSSQETGNIIKTIDDIAFQTNLLALNAAVEAARAGEAGAGFAVVADEVRKLAMRAAEAAKITNELIDKTINSVKEGHKLTVLTHKAFKENVAISAKVGNLVDEIAVASKEQDLGISQINTAVSEMEKIIQANLSNSEQVAVASQQLQAEDKRLQDAVKQVSILINGATSSNNRFSSDSNMSLEIDTNQKMLANTL